MLSLYHGALPTSELYTQWEAIAQSKNCGALSIFSGIVRKEQILESHSKSPLGSSLKSNDVEALSFDIYKPLLEKWFNLWQKKAHNMGAYICMAHSIGDVPCAQSSFMCALISSHRKVALDMYAEFVEDFKMNAPIWKYDIINGQRIYAKERSKALKGSGILCR